MTILAPNGKPISAERRTYVELSVFDHPAGSTEGRCHKLGFVLDDPSKVDFMIGNLTQALRSKLNELGVYKPMRIVNSTERSERGGDVASST